MTPTLGELFTKYGSDKNTYHSYAETYERLFGPRREAVRDFLEVGIARGASLRAWRDFFPTAEIVGMDAFSDMVEGEPRITSVRADSTNAGAVAAVLSDRMFDAIVDDGCHQGHAQEATWRVLWPRLRPGGIYVIEDVAHSETAESLAKLGGGEVIYLQHERPGRWDNCLVVYAKT